MHDIGLYYYDPEDEYFLFVLTVAGNKESFRKQQIKVDEQARGMYESLGYP